MSILLESYAPGTRVESPVEALSRVAQPLLREVPALLEYRSEADPDAEFIPKTVAGFAMGALAMGVGLDLGEALLVHHTQPFLALLPGLITRFAFMLGIIGVSASLLLVGLKVRADHCNVPLYSKHWLNSIGTGAMFAMMMYGSYMAVSRSIMINRFMAAALLMIILTFPAVAAKWTIGPHKELQRPE